MDLLTQGLLGAATAQAGASKPQARLAALTGFIAGLLPDADALIQSPADPLLVLEYHRHFSHSLLFIPVGAALVTLVLWPLLRKSLSWPRIYYYALLGIGLAGILDACTSYGTQLLWPFSDARIAWSIIAIVDPVFTLLLGVPVIAALTTRTPRLAQAGLALASLYLLLGVMQHQRALNIAVDLAAQRGHEVKRILVKPTLANLLLWRSVYESNGIIYVDGIRAGLFAGHRIYPGGALPRLDPADLASIPPHSRLARDVRRFAALSEDWIAIHPEQPALIGDIRYAMLPTRTEPLWGIRIDPALPDQAPLFITRRTLTPAMRKQFTAMLMGKDIVNNSEIVIPGAR